VDQQVIPQQIAEMVRAVEQLSAARLHEDSDSDSMSPSILSENINPMHSSRANPRSGRSDTSHSMRDRDDQGFHPCYTPPKLSFPLFEGENPKIWLDKYKDYFKICHVPNTMWVTAAALHMKENAARWWQVFKVTDGVCTRSQFCKAVEEKFGADDYRQTISNLLEYK
jgi:hypothetical protein